MSVTQLGPFPGEWADVDWSPADGDFVFARLERPGILHVQRQSFSLGRWGLYLRAAADWAGNVCCVLQDARDRNPATGQFYPAIIVLFPTDGQPREIPCPAGPAFGQNCVEVWRGSGTFNFNVVVQTSPTTYWWGGLTQDPVDRAMWGWFDEMPGIDMPATSQGFADKQQRTDDVRFSVPGMVCPSTVSGLSIGQNTDGADRLRGLYAGRYFTALQGTAFEPHLASDGQARWMGCARTPQGAALFSLVPPFEAEQRPPDPPPPPPPPPDPPQEPPPMPVPTPDPELTLLAQRLETKYHAPTAQGGLGRGPTETFVDPLGASRWRRDYFIHRDGGASPDEAWRRINRAINDIVPELEGDIDPNFP